MGSNWATIKESRYADPVLAPLKQEHKSKSALDHKRRRIMKHINRRMNPTLTQEVTYSWEQHEQTGQKLLFNFACFTVVFGVLYFFLT